MEFFKKPNCTRRSGSCNFSFLKNSLVQINSKLNSKPYDYLYKLHTTQFNYHYLSTTIRVITVVKMLWTHEAQPSESATNFVHCYRLVIDKSTYHEKPHFDLFFTTISTTKKMFFFFRARAEKGIA